MTWGNLKGEFQILLNDAMALKRESRAMRPSLGMLLNRSALDQLEARVDSLFEAFALADSRLAQAGQLDVGINGLIIESASYSIVASARESVRTLIHEAQSDVNDLRNRLNNLVFVILALLALVVSVLALFK